MPGRIAPGVYVHVNEHVYGPGDVPSAEDAPSIRNPACWENGVVPDDVEPSPAPEGPVAPPPPVVPTPDPGGGDQPPVVPEIPPKSGKGSGTTHWAAYAEALGAATVDDEGKPLERHQIIDALDAAGFPTE